MWTKAMSVILATLGPCSAQGFEDAFHQVDPSAWYVANYDFNNPSFDTDWRPDQVIANDGLTLELKPQSGKANRFVGGSLRRHTPTRFGRYEVRLQAARGEGVVTGFFTYTGPHYGTRHDEIDIEFLGKNTRQMHVAWFVDGDLSNHFIDLGFDAAGCIHDYAFEWAPEGLKWFVNDQLVFEHQARNGAIPSVPSRLFANIWAADPSISIWSGTITPGISASARIERIRFIPGPSPAELAANATY